jgi:hypothetical protein
MRLNAPLLERFHNLRALCGAVEGAFYLRKKALESGGFGVRRLWNRYKGQHIR